MITVTFNRHESLAPNSRRWAVSGKHCFLKRIHYSVSDASVARLFRAAMAYGYQFHLA